MKTILMLGGAIDQVKAIETAKAMEYRTILCDREKNNPGQFFADLFYIESTTNKRALTEIAREEKIDGIISYGVDSSLTTASYIAEKFILPTTSYKITNTLCNKALFRNFLEENGFNTPLAKVYKSVAKAVNEIGFFKFPVLVKPADASFSRGISKVFDSDELKEALEYAFSFSDEGEVIVEEYVGASGNEIIGDAIVLDGKLKAICLGSTYFNKKGINPYIRTAATFPHKFKKGLEVKIKTEIQKLIDKLQIKSSLLTLKIRADKKGNIFFLDVSPRNGSNYIWQIIKGAMNIDTIDLALKLAMGEKVLLSKQISFEGYWAYVVINSENKGKLKNVLIADDVKEYIVEENMFVQNGEEVAPFISAKDALGVLIMKFESNEQMQAIIKKQKEWLHVDLY
jgi:biotin carboxylase